MADIPVLVYRCQQGELAAFSELFRRFEARVYRLALAILDDTHDAEDATQEVFLRVFRQIKNYQSESAFETWLTAIAVNYCRDRLRQRKVRRAISLDWLRGRASKLDVSQVVAERQSKETLWSLVSQLEEPFRLPIILRYQENLSCEEIGLVLNLRTSVVYSRLKTARTQLRRMLKEQSIEASESQLWGTSFIENES